MSATRLTYNVAHEHISDLMQHAERRRAAEARSPRRVSLSIPRGFMRCVPRTATA